MKKLLTLSLSLISVLALAQPDDDDIVYFEDSEVRNSRFSFALLANPNYTGRNLINDEIPQGGGLELRDESATGDFAFNYNLDVFFTLSSALDIGVGIGRAEAYWGVERAQIYNTESLPVEVPDTLTADVNVASEMWTVPIKLNFNTSISEIFDLEVVPTVSLVFVDKYDVSFRPESAQDFNLDLTDRTRDLNYRVGISLGGTWYFADNWGFFLRANANYLLNSMVEIPDYPRETLYSVGADLGIKLRF